MYMHSYMTDIHMRSEEPCMSEIFIYSSKFN